MRITNGMFKSLSLAYVLDLGNQRLGAMQYVSETATTEVMVRLNLRDRRPSLSRLAVRLPLTFEQLAKEGICLVEGRQERMSEMSHLLLTLLCALPQPQCESAKIFIENEGSVLLCTWVHNDLQDTKNWLRQLAKDLARIADDN